MKKIGLLTTLLVAGLLLTGCNKTCTDDCLPEDWEKNNQIQCGNVYDPICGEDGKVYSNGCYLNVAGAHWDETLGVKNDECFKITKESLYGKYILTRYNDNHNVRDNHNIELNISADGIFVKFCNHLGTSDYSLSGNILTVEEMSQTEMACEGENGEWLMNAESEFNLNDARVTLSEDNLTISTSRGAQYQFQISDEYNQFLEAGEQPQKKIDNTGWEWTNTTESNNYYTYRAKIVRTGNIYDYINEEYGFQFTLPESWNGCIVAHQQSVNNQTAKIDYESFQLLCPRKYAGSNEMHSYIPEGYSETANLIVIGPDTDEWTLNSVADQELIENNKYKFGFGITGGSRDIFDGKIILSDLECGKYPNCLCIEKQSYEVGEFWDNVPNPHQDIGCFVVSILKNHIEIFDPAN